MPKTSIFLTAALAAASLMGVAQAQTQPTAPPAAQTPPVNQPPATDPASPTASPGDPTASAPAPSTGAAAPAPSPAQAQAQVSVGMQVKDNTGAAIGQVTDVKPDASGKQMATIAMGADKFAVDASSLGVEDGAATINLTAAQLQTMIKKPAS